MEWRPLYTIGHSSRKAEDFLALLQKYDIRYLVDVRSRPYSRFHPQFNREILQAFLAENGITYVFMGDLLGGRPQEPSCYDENGRLDYALVQQQDFFIRGIERLKTAYEKNTSLAIMCSERKPQDCHRSRLIGNALCAEQVALCHIDENGRIKDHTMILEMRDNKTGNLFY